MRPNKNGPPGCPILYRMPGTRPTSLAFAGRNPNNGFTILHPTAAILPDAARKPLMTPYSSLCDDFGVFVYVNTKTELPTNRETVLHFFEGLQKTLPQLTDFECRESGEFVLEEDRDQGSYRWVGLDSKRL